MIRIPVGRDAAVAVGEGEDGRGQADVPHGDRRCLSGGAAQAYDRGREQQADGDVERIAVKAVLRVAAPRPRAAR